MLLIFWGGQHNYWSTFENINLSIWQDTLIDSPSNAADTAKISHTTIRITDVRLDASGLKKINQIAQKHPKATFAIIGDYTHSFIDGLNSSTYHDLSEIAVLMGRANRNSLSALSLGEHKLAFYQGYLSLNASLFNRPSPIKWSALENVQMALQPEQESAGQSAVWRNNSGYYPSFIAQSVIRHTLGRKASIDGLKLNFNQGVDLEIGAAKYPLGLYGEITPAQKMLSDKKLSDLLVEPVTIFQGIIIIDDLSVKNSYPIAASIASLASQNYFYSNLLTKITELIFAFLSGFTHY